MVLGIIQNKRYLFSFFEKHVVKRRNFAPKGAKWCKMTISKCLKNIFEKISKMSQKIKSLSGQIWHKKCQNLTHLFVIDSLTQKVSKNETFYSISISREYVPKQEP